jgi:hypothetical protein
LFIDNYLDGNWAEFIKKLDEKKYAPSDDSVANSVAVVVNKVVNKVAGKALQLQP